MILPDASNADDYIRVGVVPPNPVEGDPTDLLLEPGMASHLPESDKVRRIEVDGRDAVRIDTDMRVVMVMGKLSSGKFMVGCAYRWHEAEVRAACDTVLASLKIREP